MIILSAEDAASFTIRPAIETAGGDLSRVVVLDAVVEASGRERLLQLATDLPKLEKLIDEVKPELVIINPLSAYFGTVLDSYRDTDVRAVLAPLVKLAETRQVGILGIMHVGKSTDRQARHRVLGSVAFTNAARLVFAIGPDPEDPERRLLLPVKANLCREAPTLAFRLEDAHGVAMVVWESGPVENVTADSVLAGKRSSGDEDQEDAESVIGMLLDTEEWPLDAKVALETGRALGIHERTMRRAARKLGIDVRKSGFRGGWRWHRPKAAGKTPDSKDSSNQQDGAPKPRAESDPEEDESDNVPKVSPSAPSGAMKRTGSPSAPSQDDPCIRKPSEEDNDESTRVYAGGQVQDEREPADGAPVAGQFPCVLCSQPDCAQPGHGEAASLVRLLDEYFGPLEEVTFEPLSREPS